MRKEGERLLAIVFDDISLGSKVHKDHQRKFYSPSMLETYGSEMWEIFATKIRIKKII